MIKRCMPLSSCNVAGVAPPHTAAFLVTGLLVFCRWMKDVYAPFLLSAKGKALVLLSFAGLLAAGLYGVAEVTMNGISGQSWENYECKEVTSTLVNCIFMYVVDRLGTSRSG